MKKKNMSFVKPGGLDLKDRLVSIQRVTKVTKGGRAFGFSAIVVVGNVDVPPTWIDATIGYLNQAEKVYKLKVVVEEGSEVRFIDED